VQGYPIPLSLLAQVHAPSHLPLRATPAHFLIRSAPLTLTQSAPRRLLARPHLRRLRRLPRPSCNMDSGKSWRSQSRVDYLKMEETAVLGECRPPLPSPPSTPSVPSRSFPPPFFFAPPAHASSASSTTQRACTCSESPSSTPSPLTPSPAPGRSCGVRCKCWSLYE
jgi:hypothetical protein